MPRVLRFRLILVCICVGLVAAAIGSRLYTLQIEHHERFMARATEQHEREFSLPARRGSLLDRHGRPLAISLKSSSLYVHPHRVENIDAAADALVGTIPGSRRSILKKLKSDEPFVWLERFLDPDTAQGVENLGRSRDDEDPQLAVGKGKPFDFKPETRRRYPRGRVASHVIGHADWDGNGQSGAEQRFDETLQGDPTVYLEIKDARQGSIQQVVRPPARQSSDVRLTLDLSLQHLLERELDRAVRDTGSKAAMALILEPRTGQVLAMANRPTTNRDGKNRGSVGTERTNRAIEHNFEPGSTFKAVTMALALEAGVVNPGDRIYCEEGVHRTDYGRTIKDVGRNGMLTPEMILAKSSNIGMTKIVSKLDRAALREGIVRFGFGRKTNIELPAESPGRLSELQDWSKFSRDSLSFGQEIDATALQVASAMATIANDGVRVEPRIGLGAEDADGVLNPFEPGPSHRVVSAQTARTMRRMLETVVEKGSGNAARLPGYRVAGKSGTAQKSLPSGQGYSETDFYSSFVGFAPASDPELVVLVALDTPRGTRLQGGETAAPVFGKILAEALQYLRVPKDAEPPLSAGFPPMAQDSFENASSNAEVTPGRVPDVRDRTLREAIRTLSAHGYRVRVNGSGNVLSQSPAPGTALEPGGVCDLRAGSRGAFAGRRTRPGEAG